MTGAVDGSLSILSPQSRLRRGDAYFSAPVETDFVLVEVEASFEDAVEVEPASSALVGECASFRFFAGDAMAYEHQTSVTSA